MNTLLKASDYQNRQHCHLFNRNFHSKAHLPESVGYTSPVAPAFTTVFISAFKPSLNLDTALPALDLIWGCCGCLQLVGEAGVPCPHSCGFVAPAGTGQVSLSGLGWPWPVGACKSQLEPVEASWSQLELVRAIWSHLEPAGAGWSQVEPVGDGQSWFPTPVFK